MLPNLSQTALDAVFAAFGRAASFVPAGGDPVAVTAIVKRPDVAAPFFQGTTLSATCLAEIRVSEAAALVRGDGIVVGGEAFIVAAEPRRLDPERLVWTLDCVPAA